MPLPQVLFVCAHNSGRSQMAKALFNSLARERDLPWRAESAGTQPADRTNATVVEATQEVGLDLSQARPQLLSDAMVRQARRVIKPWGAPLRPTPARRSFPDPEGLSIEGVRTVWDEVRRKVVELVCALEATKQAR